ncbi:uncharacterized protein Dere_GG26484 [Drosophila erecta]|uniref:Uncharacterized protein n=1 Tax=Drosophila erecta TaxID=7220 RepID=A0A0Q5TIU4_DROER|nr:uncharacterized protein Dere_GG26484 [Drosophila erecta]
MFDDKSTGKQYNWTTESPLRSFRRLTHTGASNRTCLSAAPRLGPTPNWPINFGSPTRHRALAAVPQES